MFALEIRFPDQVSQPETIAIRRPQAIVGACPEANVELEDMRALPYSLRLVRELGRKFRIKTLSPDGQSELSGPFDGVYETATEIDLGPVKMFITALDYDLMLKETEPTDRAGVRVMRQSSSSSAPIFPAIMVRGQQPMVVSFAADQPIYIGRSKQCALRLDSPEVSARHARMGYEDGQFWIEDLGSTNGTFVNKQQIAGRVTVAPGTPIILGRETSVLGVDSIDQLASIDGADVLIPERFIEPERRYPALVSVSEVARPARVMVGPGASISIGRDQHNDLWLGAPHVSRKHCSVTNDNGDLLVIRDHSTNGTAYDGGTLMRGDSLEVSDVPRVLNFGGGVTVALCFDENQERAFVASQGAPDIFAAAGDVRAPPPRTKSMRAERDRNSTPERRQAEMRELTRESVFSRYTMAYRGLGVGQRLVVVSSFLVIIAMVLMLVMLIFS